MGTIPFFNGSIGDLKKLELERKALDYFRAKKKKNPLSLPAQTTTEILYKTPCQKRVVSRRRRRRALLEAAARRRESKQTHTYIITLLFF